jgi:cytochrome P450
MLDAWSKSDVRVIDLHAEMMALTLRIVGRALFGIDLAGEAKAIGDAVSVGIQHANDYAESIVRVPPWVPTLANVRFKRAVRVLDRMVLGIIEERRKKGDAHAERDDLLGMLMAARDDENRGMTDQQLRDEIMTLVLAGHETTANALSWTFALLSRHADADRRVHDEVRVLGTPRFDDLPRLPYVAKVVQESLRLYPPVWVFEREALAADVIGGYAIPKGTVVAVSPWALHRNPAHWSNPEGFDPERFDPGASEARAKCAYLPFATGPRQCIGDAFAKMEAHIVVAAVARKFRLELLPGVLPEPDPKVTLRPRGGLPMRCVPR